jgi:hypothetical protein
MNQSIAAGIPPISVEQVSKTDPLLPQDNDHGNQKGHLSWGMADALRSMHRNKLAVRVLYPNLDASVNLAEERAPRPPSWSYSLRRPARRRSWLMLRIFSCSIVDCGTWLHVCCVSPKFIKTLGSEVSEVALGVDFRARHDRRLQDRTAPRFYLACPIRCCKLCRRISGDEMLLQELEWAHIGSKPNRGAKLIRYEFSRPYG